MLAPKGQYYFRPYLVNHLACCLYEESSLIKSVMADPDFEVRRGLLSGQNEAPLCYGTAGLGFHVNMGSGRYSSNSATNIEKQTSGMKSRANPSAQPSR